MLFRIVIYSINKVSRRETARSMLAFNFSTPLIKMPHDKLLQVVNEIICYIFKQIALKIRRNSRNGRG